jgi:para-nitrobenzyl esterase
VTVIRRLGIPYAHADRFQSPVLAPFDAARSYDRFGPSAPQPLDSPLGSIVPGMRVRATDEHACLTLNVWSPDDADALPVLVWFHGGSFLIGASSQPVYDGTLLAEEQHVVVVSVNYRLGALGFLDARPFGGVANCGLRDALCALSWVQEHIAALGGDPACVVAFGESAGAGLLLHAVASHRAPIAGAIIQSGATFATFEEERAALVRDTLVKELGGADLTTAPVDGIVAAQGRALTALINDVGMMPFHPMVDHDVLRAKPVDALDVSMPLLVGTTSDEMRLFVGDAPLDDEKLLRRVSRYLDMVGEQSEPSDVIGQYDGDNAARWCAFFSDREMVLPALAMCEAHAPHGPTYSYLFTWEGPGIGSCHGIDIPFAFGNFVDGWDAFVGADNDAYTLSRAMRDAWAAFARAGDPGWPAFPATMVFGRASHVVARHPYSARLEGAAR